MQLCDLISPTTPAGTALFLKWDGFHIFSIPMRELGRSQQAVRFFGVGGKRSTSLEPFVECALREGREEIGGVISSIDDAEQTYLLMADGSLALIELNQEMIRPRLILEKRDHSGYGSMTDANQSYYLVAFDASLSAKPTPRNEIAALLYLTDRHLEFIHCGNVAIAEVLQLGAQIDYQPNTSLNAATILIPHGTANFLIKQQTGI